MRDKFQFQAIDFLPREGVEKSVDFLFQQSQGFLPNGRIKAAVKKDDRGFYLSLVMIKESELYSCDRRIEFAELKDRQRDWQRGEFDSMFNELLEQVHAWKLA